MLFAPTMKIYGIKNCDTMKKAMAWLEANGVPCEFVDYKGAGVVADRFPHWLAGADWETLLNRRGLTWKKLADSDREDVEAQKAARLMNDYPTLIRRPVIEHGARVIVGFDPARYALLFKK